MSAAMIMVSLCLEVTDLALASDIRCTSSSGPSAGSISSAQSLASTSNLRPIFSSNSLRRGDDDASMILFISELMVELSIF